MTMTEANPRIPSKISIRWLWPDFCISFTPIINKTIEIFLPMLVQMLRKFKLFIFLSISTIYFEVEMLYYTYMR